jgi:hypothetical protein
LHQAQNEIAALKSRVHLTEEAATRHRVSIIDVKEEEESMDMSSVTTTEDEVRFAEGGDAHDSQIGIAASRSSS